LINTAHSSNYRGPSVVFSRATFISSEVQC
jgi:hypothetical protein